MITHVVLFRLKDRSPENIDKAKKVLEGLSGMVPVLRHLEVGVDLIKSERSYDIALTAKFDSLEDQTVTVRDRDTWEQERVNVDRLKEYLSERIG